MSFCGCVVLLPRVRFYSVSRVSTDATSVCKRWEETTQAKGGKTNLVDLLHISGGMLYTIESTVYAGSLNSFFTWLQSGP